MIRPGVGTRVRLRETYNAMVAPAIITGVPYGYTRYIMLTHGMRGVEHVALPYTMLDHYPNERYGVRFDG